MATVPNDEEMLSQQLIARLLDEEGSFATAAALQLHFALQDSTPKRKGHSGWHVDEPLEDQDSNMAIKLMANEAWAVADSAIAQTAHNREGVQTLRDRQLAMKLAVAEQRDKLDLEFARALQRLEDEGERDISDPSMQDVEDVLGGDVVQTILSNSAAHDPNVKGKGKAPAHANASTKPPTKTISGPPTCGICLDSFLITCNPATVSKGPTSSTRLPFGLRLPCPQDHAYCLKCLKLYLQSKLEEGNTGSLVFPIRCPECPIDAWSFEDEVAARVLDSADIVKWHSQKLLDTIPRFYCPNRHCSIRLEVDDDGGEPQGQCPACSSAICIPCRAPWHSNLSCGEYQSLPATDRNPEDQLALRLAKEQKWKRCPKCQVIVELNTGCNHITCTCSHQFCYKCGSDWDIQQGRCKRSPSCELWDEGMLLEPQEQEPEPEPVRERVALAPLQRPAMQLEYFFDDPEPFDDPVRFADHVFQSLYGNDGNDAPHQRGRNQANFDWLRDPGVANTPHHFTQQTISNLTCLYCNARLTSMADLIYHLEHVRSHQVWACCGRLFRREEDFQRHQNSARGYHHHTIAP